MQDIPRYEQVPFEIVYVDEPLDITADKESAVYDKPFVAGSGVARHILGTYVVNETWEAGLFTERTIARIFVRFDSGEFATAIVSNTKEPGPIQTYIEREKA